MTKFKRERKSIKKFSALLSADWHLREDSPICRLDDYWKTQNNKVDFIFDLATRYKVPILISGDLGNKPRWSCRLLEWFISKVPDNLEIFVIAGQHDLINHRLDLWESSGIGVLHAAGVINFIQEPKTIGDNFIIYPFSYGQKIFHIEKQNYPAIAMTHQMIVEKKDLFPDQNALRGHQLLKKFSEFSIICSGDNHQSFVSEYKNNFLINAGGIIRSNASEINHKPRVYLWNAKDNEVEAMYLPIKQGVISREHIDIVQERDERIEAYVSHLKKDYKIVLDYSDNMEEFLKKNRVRKRVKEKIWEAIGE